MPEHRLEPHLSQWIVQTLSQITATYAVLQGVFIVLGGAPRWAGSPFDAAMSVPGAPASWGAVLAVLGVVTMAGTLRPRLRIVAWALYGIGLWSLFFAVSLAITLVTIPNTPTTGPFAYAYMGIVALVLAVAYRRSR